MSTTTGPTLPTRMDDDGCPNDPAACITLTMDEARELLGDIEWIVWYMLQRNDDVLAYLDRWPLYQRLRETVPVEGAS